MNAGRFIDFLKALLDSVPGKIFLIIDGHPVHKAMKVSEFVRDKADGRLRIFFLPPYSPDLNPDEWVWNNVKNDRISRGVTMSKSDLKAKAIGALRRLQKLPDIVRGFFRDPKLAYILELTPGKATDSLQTHILLSILPTRTRCRLEGFPVYRSLSLQEVAVGDITENPRGLDARCAGYTRDDLAWQAIPEYRRCR